MQETPTGKRAFLNWQNVAAYYSSADYYVAAAPHNDNAIGVVCARSVCLIFGYLVVLPFDF